MNTTSIYKKMPAALLAAALAALLIVTAGFMQTSHAAAKQPAVSVWIETPGWQTTALPGGQIDLTAQTDYSYTGEGSPEIEFEWDMIGGTEKYASVALDPDDSAQATVIFADTTSKSQVSVKTKVTMYVGGQAKASGQITLTRSSDFMQLEPAEITSGLAIGESVDVTAELLHFTPETPDGEPVEDVSFSWYYDNKILEVRDAEGNVLPKDKAVKGSAADFTITRLQGTGAVYFLDAVWGEDQQRTELNNLYSLDEISTDLKDYHIEFPELDDNWAFYIDDGSSFIPEVRVMNGDYELSEENYDLKVERYIGYDENTFDSLFEPAEFPLTHVGKDDPEGEPVLDKNGNRLEGTNTYRITATGKNGFTGKTESYEGYVFVFSRNSLTPYGADTGFNSRYHKWIDEYPYLRYEVKPGTVLTPKVTIDGERLTRGEDYTVRYINRDTMEVKDSFPTAAGVYTVVFEGTGEYYGYDDTNELKVGYAGSVKLKAKTLKLKPKKKKTFAAKKAFTVTNAKGKVTYKKLSGNKKITVAANGKVTVKKGLKKGKTYKVKVQIRDSGSSKYYPSTATAVLKVKIKKK